MKKKKKQKKKKKKKKKKKHQQHRNLWNLCSKRHVRIFQCLIPNPRKSIKSTQLLSGYSMKSIL